MIEVYNPMTYLKKEVATSRPLDLNDKKVALLDNNKPNVDLLFEHLEDSLSEKLKPRSIVRLTKANTAHAAPEEIVKKIIQEAEVVINGVGD